jgi:hypothetical protein
VEGVAGDALGGLGADGAGAFEPGRLVCAEVQDDHLPVAPRALVRAAGVSGERGERGGGGLLPLVHDAVLLVLSALGFRDLSERVFEDDALLEWQARADAQHAPAFGPRRPAFAPALELLIIDDRGWRECARAL